MLNEKIEMVEKTVGELKDLQNAVNDLINERKLRFADVGINQVVVTVSELIVLEKILDSINCLFQNDSEGLEIPTIDSIKHECKPNPEEVFDFISMKYRHDMADDCKTLKKFIDSIQYQSVTEQLFPEVSNEKYLK